MTRSVPAAEPEASRFTALWKEHAPRVLAYAQRHTDPETAHEVVSETFLVAWRRLSDVPGEPLPWLLVVARNTLANHRRSGYRQAMLQSELQRLTDVAGHGPAAEIPAVERQAMLAALAALTATEREALLLVAWDGLGTAQAAHVAGCSAPTFAVRLHRARRRLREATADPEPASLRIQTPCPRSAS
ncbi:sigma-70 family RNA polymerase sigma factor [Blastococcus sp. LR1]|nr:sigma-70 family RNA polymerase sigma factor [Blastococcus sp. LR1]